MKILQVINGLEIGGAEKFLVNMVPILKSKGYTVEVLLLKDSNTHFKTQLIDQKITIHSLVKKSSVYNPLLIIKLIKYINNYDIIHVHLFPAQYWVALAKFITFSKVKLITTEHNTTNRRRLYYIFRLIDRFIYNQFIKIIAVSVKACETLSSHLKIQNIQYIPNSVNVHFFSHSLPYSKYELLRIKNECIVLAMVAAFRVAKDQDTIIKTLPLLPDSCHLILVGDGKRRTICEQLVKELDLQSRVHFLGVRSDVERVLKTADIVILSSHWEGLSLSSIEGMAVGKPFIGSAVNGIVEAVEGAGLLFKEGNSEELSLLIKKLIHENSFYKIIAQRCFERALQYDINQIVVEYEQVYAKI